MKSKAARIILISICALALLLTVNVISMAASTETLTIKGDGVRQAVTFDRVQLEAMNPGISQHKYSVTNNFPTDKVMYRKGVSLKHLLDQAGVLDTAKQLKFISSDGYTRSFTYQELIDDTRYCFAADGSRAIVPTMIAFADSSQGYASMQDIELALTMGQRIKGEQNNPWFVKYLQTIEVSTREPEQWPAVSFRTVAGADGISVELKHNNFDLVKMYYTTDGSAPSINSKVYNISASYYQPELNRPITVSKNTEIRAIAVGAGKRNSETASSIDSAAGAVFSDLQAFPWAESAITELNREGIIDGMGDARFAPAEPLTRAQFAKMMILALGQAPDVSFSSGFSDVKNSDWHWPYVQKAARLGLLEGYLDGSFGPDRPLSREEMLTIAVRAMGVKVENETVSAELLRPFEDEARISDWARPYLAHAEDKEIVEHGHLAVESGPGLAMDAQGVANRAEAAVTIQLLREKIRK
ncbi:MAG TPA: hypothetical protein DER60_10085 [Syntrophomonas sp.]|nr:hypothetical protein [Syntrophomonas sp.]